MKVSLAVVRVGEAAVNATGDRPTVTVTRSEYESLASAGESKPLHTVVVIDETRMPETPRIAVWHRDDLRITDNRALSAAVTDGEAYPFFVFDPEFYRSNLVNDRRIRFLHEALDELDATYRALGSRLALFHGAPEAVLSGLDADRVYMNRSVTARYGKERDGALIDRPRVEAYATDGIVRDSNPRENWDTHIDEYFTEKADAAPCRLPAQILAGDISAGEIEAKYQITPEKTFPYRGGLQTAWEQLEKFTRRIGNYPGRISDPAKSETGTSHLSPYFKFGCLSVREAAQYVQQMRPAEAGADMFIERLVWNRNFKQKLADWPKATRIAINPVMRGLWRARHDEGLVRAWKSGETGYPLVDASMRALRETGWMNFRMRAMSASFYSYILQCYWRVGANHFYRHLIDADPAINYGQWQIQAGLTGQHPLRVYDPMKQVREHDPEGEFIFKYVPELEGIPVAYLPEPWKMPPATQQEAGISIGEEYPRPVVDYAQRKTAAESVFEQILDRASEALRDPVVWRRASLSSRHEQPGADEDLSTDTAQQTIKDFSEN